MIARASPKDSPVTPTGEKALSSASGAVAYLSVTQGTSVPKRGVTLRSA